MTKLELDRKFQIGKSHTIFGFLVYNLLLPVSQLFEIEMVYELISQIEILYPVKNLISQRCHGEIMIYSQLPHTITSLQHNFEAAHLTHHDIN